MTTLKYITYHAYMPYVPRSNTYYRYMLNYCSCAVSFVAILTSSSRSSSSCCSCQCGDGGCHNSNPSNLTPTWIFSTCIFQINCHGHTETHPSINIFACSTLVPCNRITIGLRIRRSYLFRWIVWWKVICFLLGFIFWKELATLCRSCRTGFLPRDLDDRVATQNWSLERRISKFTVVQE